MSATWSCMASALTGFALTARRRRDAAFRHLPSAALCDKVTATTATSNEPRSDAHDRTSRDHSLRRASALPAPCACRTACARASGAPPSWCCTASAATRPPSNVHAADQGAQRARLRHARLRHARLRRRARASAATSSASNRSRTPATRSPSWPSIRRSTRDRIALIGSSFGGAVAVYAGGVDPARRGGDLERRLGRRRAQVPRPASRRRRPGRSSPTCWRRAAATAPRSASR